MSQFLMVEFHELLIDSFKRNSFIKMQASKNEKGLLSSRKLA